jgi:1,4-dihydroxy-2-naphthoate octaprenyltransferase
MAAEVGAKPGSASPAVGWHVWWLAARPKTLPAAAAPIIVGSAVAHAADGFHAAAALIALAVALLLQIAANFANDVFDFHRGADTAARTGPLRVTQHGLVTPRRMFLATGLVIGLATLLGLYLVWRGGWPILMAGLLAILAAVAYTGGPKPLGYHGLGEVAVFLFFGLAGVAGTAYVQTLDLTRLAVAASIPVGCLATAILVVNNLRDRETDHISGKRTLAVRLGRRGSIGEYAALLATAYLVPPILWLAGWISGWWWLTWLSLPLALILTRRIATMQGPALNPLLAGTARLHLLFGILFAAAIVL